MQPATTGPEASGDVPVDPLLTGVGRYRRDAAPRVRPLMRRLAAGQHPHSMLLACADSRVLPHLITASEPGEVFTVQNVGNLVHGSSVEAAVRYALDVLAVTTIAVCGHSGCGAMRGLCEGVPDGALARWLRGGAPALAAWRLGTNPVGAPDDLDLAEPDRLSMTNVVVQLDALRALVGPAESAGSVALVGLFLHIPSADVLVYDARAGSFR